MPNYRAGPFFLIPNTSKMEKKIKHFQKVITLNPTETRKEIGFNDVPGTMIGYATTAFGDLPANTHVDIAIYDGGLSLLYDIDQGFSELKTNNTVEGKIVPLYHEDPNDIKAVINTSNPIAAGKTYAVKVIIFYVPTNCN